MRKGWILFAIFQLWCFSVQAETLGKLQLETLLFRAGAQLTEGSKGEFDLSESSIAASWALDSQISARFRLGSKRLMNQPIIYSGDNTNEFGFFEGYGQYQGLYGRIRFGILPLNFGVGGTLQESNLEFLRPLYFRNRIVGLRDFGISYYMSHNGFFTELTAHNGEGPASINDGLAWYTASWGWSNEKTLNAGFSGQTGSTHKESTATSTALIADFDTTKSAHWRHLTAFAHWTPNEWDVRLELFSGERDQDKRTKRFYAGHLDFGYSVSDKLKLMTRYESFDPSSAKSGDAVSELSIGTVLRNTSRTSAVIFLATKVMEERGDQANDRLNLIWQLSPSP